MVKDNLQETVNSVIDVAMSRLKEAIDVNTIVGKPFKVDLVTIVPISKVSVGIVAGGGELGVKPKNSIKDPFAGGSGSGFMVTPIGFLTMNGNDVKYVACGENTGLAEVIKITSNLLKKVVVDNKEGTNEN